MRRYSYPLTLLSLAIFALVVLGAVAPARLSTTMAAEKPESFTFVVFGDNRPDRPDLPQPEAFKIMLREADARRPAFAVNTGDCIYGSSNKQLREKQYKDYCDTLQSLFKPKVYLALGNHELHGGRASQEFFAKELGNIYYSFDYADSHFIVLDSEVVGEAGHITGKQLEWLKEDLKKSRAARHKFVFLHRPLYPVDGHMGRSLDQHPAERDALHRLFVQNRITAVFAGHEHLFHTQIKNGVRYVITGGAGAFLYPSVEGKGDFHHFVLVSVDGDKLEMKVVREGRSGKPWVEEPIDKVSL